MNDSNRRSEPRRQLVAPALQQKEIERICRVLRAHWHAGAGLKIEDCLERANVTPRAVLLRELIATEIELRRAAGEDVARDDYAARFPSDPSAVEAGWELIADRNVEEKEAGSTLDNSEDADRDTGDVTQAVSHGPEDVAVCDEMPSQLGRFQILEFLGEGGFGRVYLAEDPQLCRKVALKVPRRRRHSSDERIKTMLHEARSAARLKHPALVAVYDVQRDGQDVFIVQEYVDGQDLRHWGESNRPSVKCIVRLVIEITEAISVAHQNDMVHRDLKPGNILIDREGHVHVADFGLALHEDLRQLRKGEVTGTPAYMSPEQVRGETHRLDGRSDLWSVGVILYELLTGRRPFRAKTQAELFDEIIHGVPKPPRQIKPELALELERICLKCLEKRRAARYNSAAELIEDLQVWFEQLDAGASTQFGKQYITETNADATPRVVPKGLRSFDAHDADFFLELLPGPRDRDGLSESLRFWKSRVEPIDSVDTFAVGLIYGPSGCGKSSLVKAGLLPRLSKHVTPIYVEATTDDTEARLEKSLHRHLDGIPADVSLVDLHAGVRQGQWIARDQRILIVLDQFEQWLHARRGEHDPELVRALRHCDGDRLQCIVLVRNDFFLAANRLMQDLEIDLVEGRNMALVDLFDPLHARKVLAEFGRALGRLPDDLDDLTRDQSVFLDRAVEGLTQDGKIICVRLALFADMLKGKTWSRTTLKQMGGMAGLGTKFLEETFSASTAPPAHRHHQKAVQRVLGAFLSSDDTIIRGRVQPYDALLEASEYTNRPRDFDRVIHILDNEIRLITPTDRSGADERLAAGDVPGQRCYQLTHDYLVPSLRDWLTQKQKETWRGRATLRLAERAAQWNAKPENRYLPKAWEDLDIRLLTRSANWTEPQRRMMCKSGRLHGARTLLAAALIVIVFVIGLKIRDRVVEKQNLTRSSGLVIALMNADIEQVPAILKEIQSYRRWADPLLQSEYTRAAHNSAKKLKLATGLLPVDSSQVDFVFKRLLVAEPNEVLVIRRVLLPYKRGIVEALWKIVQTRPVDGGRRGLAAASALALFDPTDERWPDVSQQVVERLINEDTLRAATWTIALEPVRRQLVRPLADVFRNQDAKYSEGEQDLATSMLNRWAADDVSMLADLVMEATPKQFVALFDKLKAHGEKAIRRLSAELARTVVVPWNDAPVMRALVKPDAVTVRQVESAAGLVAEHFALCQAMPMDRFLKVVSALRASSYRPIQVRPYGCDGETLVAAVWTRDGQEWQFVQALNTDEMMQCDEQWRHKGYVPVDVARYLVGQADDAVEHFAGIYKRRRKNEPDARVYAVSASNRNSTMDELEVAGFKRQERLQVSRSPDGSQVCAGVVSTATGESVTLWRDDRGGSEQQLRENLSILLVDISVNRSETRLDHRYAAVWHVDSEYESEELHGLTPPEHLRRCHELISRGYRPISIGALKISAGAPIVTASAWRRPIVPDDARESLAKRQANAAMALLRMGQADQAWPLLRSSPDPRVRSWIIHRLHLTGASRSSIVDQLAREEDVSIRRALILCLGTFPTVPSADVTEQISRELLDLYENDRDPGIHGAAEAVLRRWNQQEVLTRIDKRLATGQPESGRRWYQMSQGLTMVMFRSPGSFLIGSRENEREMNFGNEMLQRYRIDRSFAISSKEVTVGQFHQFMRESRSVDLRYPIPYAPEADCPQISVTWYEAAAYCRWLSEREGIPEDQMCYPPIPEISQGAQVRSGFLNRTGYRLPTEFEWEYACRAGTTTSRYYGQTETLLGDYAWSQLTSEGRTRPVGRLWPNDFGLFDMYGNVSEWCQSVWGSYAVRIKRGSFTVERAAPRTSSVTTRRVLRGGSFACLADNLRSARRDYRQIFTSRDYDVGFRVARTLPRQEKGQD